jgi:hypothetical protein
MFRNSPTSLFAASACALVFACSLPAHAEPKAPAVNATVVNTSANPVPVLIQGQAAQQLVSFRDGYQVPNGKRLLIDDVSVACTTIGTTLEDFRTFGLSVSTLLRITYPPANCPEPLDSEGECHQLFSVGTGRQNGIEPIFVTAGDGRPAAQLWAGRQMSVFADQGATLIGQCDGILVNLFGFSLRGSGRLIDRP